MMQAAIYFIALLTSAATGLSRQQAAECGAALWNEHREAVAAEAVAALPAPEPFDSARAATWHLPDSLESDADLDFLLATRGERPEAGWPLFIYLHGSGPRDAEWSTGKILARRWADEPSAWFIPRIPREGEYYRWWQRAKLWAWERLLRNALASGNFDPDRIYLLGISEGGYGSQRLASFYADYLAAAGPMAGGEPLVNAPTDNLRNTPFSLLTGSEDKMFYRERLTRLTGEALDSLAALSPSDYVHRVELQPGRGHAIDYSPTAPWLRTHRRRVSPRRVTWEDFSLDGCRRRAFANIEPVQRPDSAERVRYDLTIDPATNSLAITVDRADYHTVETDPHWGIALRSARTLTPANDWQVRVYLDDSMLDLDRPIGITVNGRRLEPMQAVRSAATISRAIELWGDPRRLYPASLLICGPEAR